MASPSEFLNAEMAATWQWRIETDPELAASLGLLGKRRSSHAVDPRSPESFDMRLKWMTAALDRLDGRLPPLDALGLLSADADNDGDDDGNSDGLSYKLYREQLSDYVTLTPRHKTYLCCVNRLEGPQTDLPLHARYLPVDTQPQRAFYREFLRSVAPQLTDIAELLTVGVEEGRTPPRASLGGVVDQIRAMVRDGMQSFRTPLFGSNNNNNHNHNTGNGCFDLPEEQDLMDDCTRLLDTSIPNAFDEFANYLEADYIPKLRTEISATAGYPDGDAYYASCLAFHTTTSMTAKEIHELGLSEVERIRSDMTKLAVEAGYNDNEDDNEDRLGLEDYMAHLRTAPEYCPSSGEALCAHYRDITGRIAPSLLKLFRASTLPRLPFSIVETPAASASMAPAAYYLAGTTGTRNDRPGMFYVNTSELSTRRTYECESLALHEAIPGHHTQAAIQGENASLPEFRRYCEDRRYFEAPCRFPFYTGYIEGWGLHSETLGEELGLYKTPEDKMGQLSMEALRACRLVVDTGMHAFGWSMERATDYMLANTAMGEHDARTEVTRYVTWPGQATAYKVGERTLHRLRARAESELGAELFDPRDFYDVVLLCGPVPLDMLEGMVDEYIDKQRSGSSSTSPSTKTTSSLDNTKSRSFAEASSFVETMTFATWCKCCIVPGTCQV